MPHGWESSMLASSSLELDKVVSNLHLESLYYFAWSQTHAQNFDDSWDKILREVKQFMKAYVVKLIPIFYFDLVTTS